MADIAWHCMHHITNGPPAPSRDKTAASFPWPMVASIALRRSTIFLMEQVAACFWPERQIVTLSILVTRYPLATSNYYSRAVIWIRLPLALYSY